MIAARLPALRLDHALAASAVACGIIAAWPWLVPPAPAVRAPAQAPAGAPTSAWAELPPLVSLSAIVERPLFSPSRRPTPGATAIAGPSTESRYRLLGVVAAGARKKAFVADGARRVEIGEGETLDGWVVKEIGANRIVLSSSAGEAIITLKPAAVAEPQKPQ